MRKSIVTILDYLPKQDNNIFIVGNVLINIDDNVIGIINEVTLDDYISMTIIAVGKSNLESQKGSTIEINRVTEGFIWRIFEGTLEFK